MMSVISRGNDFFNDPEYFQRFIKNVESLFRRSHPFYNYYKSYLINDIGLDRCQVNSNISVNVADLEMHHTLLTLYDIVFLITKYHLRVNGFVDTHIVLRDLIDAHKNNIVPIVMLTTTNHELYHKDNLFIPLNLIFGNFSELILKYKEGITFPIINKIKRYLDITGVDINNDEALKLNDAILRVNDWYVSVGGDNIDYSVNMYGNNTCDVI